MTGAFGALPLIGLLLPDSKSFYVFPPLGGAYATTALVLSVLVTLVVLHAAPNPFAQSKKGRFRTLCGLTLVAIGGALLFISASTGFVRQVDIPSEKTSVTVTVGFERTAFATNNFPGADDGTMLTSRGTSEQEIQRLWTMRSIIAARVLLLGAYLVFLLAAVATGSFAVLFNGLGPPSLP